MTYNEAKILADKIFANIEKRKEIEEIVNNEALGKEFEWCQREASRCDFANKREKCIYRNALFNAVRWGNKH